MNALIYFKVVAQGIPEWPFDELEPRRQILEQAYEVLLEMARRFPITDALMLSRFLILTQWAPRRFESLAATSKAFETGKASADSLNAHFNEVSKMLVATIDHVAP